MARKTISIGAGRGASITVHVATPEGGKGPALVLLRDVVGADAEVHALADRFAAEGYVVVVPDLYARLRPGAPGKKSASLGPRASGSLGAVANSAQSASPGPRGSGSLGAVANAAEEASRRRALPARARGQRFLPGLGAPLAYAAAGSLPARDLERRFDLDAAIRDLDRTIRAVRAMPRVTGGIGVVGFGLGGLLAVRAAVHLRIDAAVCYGGPRIDTQLGKAAAIRCPLVLHLAGADEAMTAAAAARVRRAAARMANVEAFTYPGLKRGFAEPQHPAWDRSAAGIAMSRSIGLLRRAIGPRYDLDALWDQHTFLEFGARDVAATMRTMVKAPYVNHIPVLTGGVGHADLARFYKYHFIPRCPQDTKLVPVSRTVGADRVVDEMLFCFTHDVEIDWMLPGIAPTGKYVEVPLVAIVAFRGPKLYHEHIYWDQASVLVQIGRLDPKGLPVAGHAQARKLLDESLPSNELMRSWSQSAGKPAP